MSRWGARPSNRVSPAVIVVAAVVTATWVVAAVLMSNHGFDLSDEGYYVLSYRWWSSTPRTVTGVQYLYGPVFELFGYDVRALRLFRLVTIVCAHAVFAWAFISWLRTLDRGPAPTRSWCWAWGLAIVATGGIAYGRLPLSPGYNDVSLLASLLLAATALRVMVGVRRNQSLSLGAALAVPPLVVVLLLAKWAAAVVVVGFVGVVTIAALRRHAFPAKAARFGAAFSGSTLLSVLMADAMMGGFGTAIPPMWQVNRLVAAKTNSPKELLSLYASSGFDLLLLVCLLSFTPLVLVAMSLFIRKRGRTAEADALVLFAPLSVVGIATIYLPGKGPAADVSRYTSCLSCLALVIGAAVLLDRRVAKRPYARTGDATGFVALLLVGLPVVQAFGTGNPVFALAIDGFAAWTALFVLAATRMAKPLARAFVQVSTVCGVVAAGLSGGLGLIDHPYRTEPLGSADTAIGGPGATARLLVAPDEARRLHMVRAALAGLSTRGRPMMAFDQLAGLIAVLDGRSVGESWYSALDHPRSAANIADACRKGNPWGNRQPIIFYNRQPAAPELDALRGCGLDLSEDYRAVQVSGFMPALTIYIPDRSDG